MIKRVLGLVTAGAALAASAGVCVVAAAYALYAVLRYGLTPAGAAAVVALVFALIAAIIAMVMLRRAHPKPRHGEEAPMSARLIELARERPVIAAGAAVAAGLVLLRNPKLVATAVTAAMAGRAAERSDQRHGWR